MRFCLSLSLLPTLLLSAPLVHAQAADPAAAPSESAPAAPATDGAAPAPLENAAPPAASYPQAAPPAGAPAASVPVAPAPAPLPPPPPGYMYVPAPAAPNVGATDVQTELMQIDDRYRQLKAERSRYSIAGPMVMMALGFGSALSLGATSLVFFAAAEDEYYYEYEYDYDDDERHYRKIARATGIAAVCGLALGITGTVLLGKRMSQRNQYKPEMLQLKRRRRELVRSLRYGANLDSRQLGLAVSGRF